MTTLDRAAIPDSTSAGSAVEPVRKQADAALFSARGTEATPVAKSVTRMR